VAYGYTAADDDDEWTLSHADSSNTETEDTSDHCKGTRLQLQVLQQTQQYNLYVDSISSYTKSTVPAQ